MAHNSCLQQRQVVIIEVSRITLITSDQRNEPRYTGVSINITVSFKQVSRSKDGEGHGVPCVRLLALCDSGKKVW